MRVSVSMILTGLMAGRCIAAPSVIISNSLSERQDIAVTVGKAASAAAALRASLESTKAAKASRSEDTDGDTSNFSADTLNSASFLDDVADVAKGATKGAVGSVPAAVAGAATGGVAGAAVSLAAGAVQGGVKGAKNGKRAEGDACTGTVNNLKMNGLCTANGKCGISIPPNEFAPVASKDCT